MEAVTTKPNTYHLLLYVSCCSRSNADVFMECRATGLQTYICHTSKLFDAGTEAKQKYSCSFLSCRVRELQYAICCIPSKTIICGSKDSTGCQDAARLQRGCLASTKLFLTD